MFNMNSLNSKNYALKILGITVVAFILQNIIPGFTEAFFLKSADVLVRPWMFVSAIFMHSGITHLFYNMFALLIFGPVVEQSVGSRKFLLLYITGGVFGNLIGIFFYPQALGASGSIMTILGCLIVLMPHLRVYIYGLIPMPLWLLGILWFGLDFFGSFTASNVGHLVHIAGLFFGLGFGLYVRKYMQKKKLLSKPQKSSNDIDDWIRRNS